MLIFRRHLSTLRRPVSLTYLRPWMPVFKKNSWHTERNATTRGLRPAMLKLHCALERRPPIDHTHTPRRANRGNPVWTCLNR